MSRDKQVVIGIDCSYEEGLVVVFNEKSILWCQYLNNKMRHATNITQVLSNAYEWVLENDYQTKALAVGIGPGSFVGTRIALATSLGFSLGKNLALVGVCSHLALANSFAYKHILLAMKAAGELFYVAEYKEDKRVTDIKVQTLSLTNLACMLISDRESINNSYKDTILCKGIKDVGFFKAFMQSYAICNLEDQSLFIKPNYVKEVNIHTKAN